MLVNEIFWKLVKDLLKDRKITQTTFANSLEIGVRTFQDWVSSKRLPDLVSAKKIADALNVSLDYLLTGVKNEEQNKDEHISKIATYYNNIKPEYQFIAEDCLRYLATQEKSCINPPVKLD